MRFFRQAGRFSGTKFSDGTDFVIGKLLQVETTHILAFYPMQAVYLIGFSIFLNGLIAGYYAYSAFQKALRPHKIRRIAAALAFGFLAVLLGWFIH
ncbi:hypothetical protein GCM10027299_44430 [Larkinella ripae]